MNARRTTIFALSALLAAFTATAHAQPTYSIDVLGPTVSSGLVGPSDVLTPMGAGVAPPPAIAIGGPLLGIIPTPVSLPELDALSYGTDPLLQNGALIEHHWSFSVDEYGVGMPGVPAPSVTSEGAFGAALEASADIYLTPTSPGPVPLGVPGINTGLFDGNAGFTPFAAPGLNLSEPNPPTPGGFDIGDHVDAWDLDQAPPAAVPGTTFGTPVYFSLDSKFADPLEPALPVNTGTAAANGFVGGDVLVSTIAGAPPALYAPASLLGLDKVAGAPDTDDLDALVLWDNGDGIYQPTDGPYSWLFGTDMLLYSVRRGSALIGATDSIMGLPIEEGDILVPFVLGTPGIFVPAESMGLATVRTSGPGGTFQGFGDDLTSLDVQERVIPEPASLILIGCAGLLLLRRRSDAA